MSLFLFLPRTKRYQSGTGGTESLSSPSSQFHCWDWRRHVEGKWSDIHAGEGRADPTSFVAAKMLLYLETKGRDGGENMVPMRLP